MSNGKQRTEWVELRKGVAYLFRYREVSLQPNARDLDALAVVEDPAQGKQALQRLTAQRGMPPVARARGSIHWRNKTPLCSRT